MEFTVTPGEGKTVKAGYAMRKQEGGGWKVLALMVDGIDMVKMVKQEIRQYMHGEGIEGAITRLEEKNAERRKRERERELDG